MYRLSLRLPLLPRGRKANRRALYQGFGTPIGGRLYSDNEADDVIEAVGGREIQVLRTAPIFFCSKWSDSGPATGLAMRGGWPIRRPKAGAGQRRTGNAKCRLTDQRQEPWGEAKGAGAAAAQTLERVEVSSGRAGQA